MPWRKLPEIQVQFDINLAPLEIDNPFGQSKSEIKYVEAALLRVPTIASPSDSYSACHPASGERLSGGECAGLGTDYLETLIEQPENASNAWEKGLPGCLAALSPVGSGPSSS